MLTKIIKNIASNFSLDDEIIKKLAGKGMVALTIKIATAGLSYLMFMLLARWMTPLEYGYFATAFSLGSFLAAVGGMGQHNMVLRYLPQYEGQKKPALAQGMLLDSRSQVLKGTLSVASAGLIVTYVLGHFEALERVSHLYWGVIFAVPMAWAEYQSHVLRACGSVTRALVPRDIIWRIILPIACFTWLWTNGSINAEITMMIAAATLGFLTLGQLSFNKKIIPEDVQNTNPQQDIKGWRKTRVGLWGSAVVGVASPQLSIVIVGVMLNPTDAGLFFVALRTASLLSLPLMAINIIAAPLIAKYYHSGEMGKLKSLLLHIVSICFIGGLIGYTFLIFAGEWILAMFGEEYKAGYIALLILGFGHFINVACGPTGYMMLMTNKERMFLKVRACIEIIVMCILVYSVQRYTLHTIASIIALGLSVWNLWMFVLMLIILKRIVTTSNKSNNG